MTTTNPFGLLDDDSEDINLLVKAIPLKVEKPAPVQTAKAVTEAKNGAGGRRDGGGRREGGGFDRGRDGGGYKRDSRNNGAPANGNGGYRRSEEGDGDGARRGGHVGGYNRDSRNNGAPGNGNGGYRRSEEGDGARRGGQVGGYRRGSFSNGDSGGFEHPRRNFDRHSGTGHGSEFKRGVDGRRNRRETTEDEIPPVNGEVATVVEKDLPVGGEGEATDANNEKPVEVRAVREPEREPEIPTFTLEEYEKVLEEKKKALQATKVEERKVDTKAFDSMQQLSSKKSNNDDVFIKLGTEKDKRTVEKEEKTKKVTVLPVMLPRYRPPYRGGRGGRGPREGGYQRNGDQRNGGDQWNGGGYPGGKGGRGPREGGDQRNGGDQKNGGDQRNEEAAAPKIVAPKIPAPKIPAPKIEDTAQFPILGK